MIKKIFILILILPSICLANIKNGFIYELFHDDQTFAKAYLYGVMDAYEHSGYICFNNLDDKYDDNILEEYIRMIILNPELKNKAASSTLYENILKNKYTCQ